MVSDVGKIRSNVADFENRKIVLDSCLVTSRHGRFLSNCPGTQPGILFDLSPDAKSRAVVQKMIQSADKGWSQRVMVKGRFLGAVVKNKDGGCTFVVDDVLNFEEVRRE